MGKNKEDLIGGLKRTAKWYLHRGHGGQKFNDNHTEMAIYHFCAQMPVQISFSFVMALKLKEKILIIIFLFSSI